MTKVGIIGCPKTTDFCWEAREMQAAREGEGIFKDIGPTEIIGCVTCGGCPGKKLANRARILSLCGADIIALSSGFNETCPHRSSLLNLLSKRLKAVIVLDSIGGKVL